MIKPKNVGIVDRARAVSTRQEWRDCLHTLTMLADAHPKTIRRVRRILELKRKGVFDAEETV